MMNVRPAWPGEVDDDVAALGGRQEEFWRGGAVRQPHRRVQQAAVGADLPDRRADRARGRVAVQLHLQEARVRRIDDAEAVAPRLDLEERPGLAVHGHDVAEELRVPERVVLGIRRWAVEPLGISVGKQDLAVGVELAIRHQHLLLEVAGGKTDRVAGQACVAAVANQVVAGEARVRRSAGRRPGRGRGTTAVSLPVGSDS
jgi:hypothetical protein